MNIDRQKVISDLSSIRVCGNEDGLIPAFGVLVNVLPTNFWNTFTEKMIASADESNFALVESKLEEAAAECGYHTGWGIINSEEFKSVVQPMIKQIPEDVLHGAYAVLGAWGWADAEIIELQPKVRKVIRAQKYYESEIKDTFPLQHTCAYMLRGISRAFMDIAYGEPYPKGLNTYVCEQTKGIEIGDPYSEFIITKA
jgi:hypothetical protein